jgi:two-component system OmpR family response regulator
MNVLIVEDAPAIAERVAQVLANVGANVVAICTMEDTALAACDRFRIDFAVIDLQLAQGTGFGVIRHLRPANQPSRAAAVLVFTNHAVPALKVASFEAGADYFFDKAHGVDQLARIYRELVTANAA